MTTIPIPWTAIVALAMAIVGVIGALWAKIKQTERVKDGWIEKWAIEVKRNAEPPEWDERTDIRNMRDRLLKEREHEINERLKAYAMGESTPPKFKR